MWRAIDAPFAGWDSLRTCGTYTALLANLSTSPCDEGSLWTRCTVAGRRDDYEVTWRLRNSVLQRRKECVTCSSGASAREETLQPVQQAPCSRNCAWGLEGKQRELRGCLGMRGTWFLEECLSRMGQWCRCWCKESSVQQMGRVAGFYACGVTDRKGKRAGGSRCRLLTCSAGWVTGCVCRLQL